MKDRKMNLTGWRYFAVLMLGLTAVLFQCDRASAFTHDDSDEIYPEFLVRYKAVAGKTANLTMSITTYSIYTNNNWTPYVETTSSSGVTSSSNWGQTNSFLMRGGIPLEMDNVLKITGNNVAEYQVMINCPDPKYQAYVDGARRLMIDKMPPVGPALNQTNHIMFFNEKRKGDNAGKVERISAGTENFRICLGNSMDGRHLGHLTLRKRYEPWIADKSFEVGLYTVGANHYQVSAPQMTFDLVEVENPTTFNYIIKAYDNQTEPGTLDPTGKFLTFGNFTPVITYTMVYTYTTSPETDTFSFTRAEGTSTMASKAESLINVVNPVFIYNTVCSGGYCVDFGDLGTTCVPEICSTALVYWQPGSASVTNFIWDWLTQGSSQPSRKTVDTVLYGGILYGNVSTMTNTRSVHWDAANQPLASSYQEWSGTNEVFADSNIFWSSYRINYDGPSENQFTGGAKYNFISPYGPQAVGGGSHLKLLSRTFPDGSWEQYSYSDSFASRGMVLTMTRPFKNTPSAPPGSGSLAGAMATTYTYATNWDGSVTVPAAITNKFLGTGGAANQLISAKVYTYTNSFAGTPGAYPTALSNDLFTVITNLNPGATTQWIVSNIQYEAEQSVPNNTTIAYAIYGPAIYSSPVWVSEQRVYAGPNDTAPAYSSVAKYRGDGWPWLADMPFYEINADGSQNDYVYEQGVIDYHSFNFQSFGFPGTVAAQGRYAFRSIKIKGVVPSSSTAGVPVASAYSENGGWYIQPIGLEPGQARAEVRTTDSYGRLFAEETWILDGNGWNVATKVVYGYDPSGNVISKCRLLADGTYETNYLAQFTGINGNSLNYSSISFDNTLAPTTSRKQYEKGEDGTIKKYYYDDYGRIVKEVKLAPPALANLPQVPATQTLYQYDAENRRTATFIGNVQTGLGVDPTAIKSTKAYNLLGMVTNVVAPGGRATQYAYANGGQTVTVTAKGINNTAYDRTVTRQYYLDKQLKSVSGNAVVPEFHDYVYLNSQKVETNYTGSSTGPTARWVTAYTDGAGRTISAIFSNPAGTADLQATGTYDAFGHLTNDSVTGLANKLYYYDPVSGQMLACGLDMDGNNNLDSASNDRISGQYTGFASQNSSYWEEAQQYVFPNKNDATTLVTCTTLKRVSGFTSGNITILNGTVVNNAILDSEIDQTDAASVTTRTLQYFAPGSALSLQRTYSSLYTSPSDQISLNGKLVCSIDSAGMRCDYTYDGYGRVVQTTDRTGNTLHYYRTATDGTATTEEQYKRTADNIWTQTDYDPAGRIDWTEQFLAKSASQPTSGSPGRFSRFQYNLRGQLLYTWGEIPVPTANVYFESSDGIPEIIGQLKNQTTYNGGGSTWTGSSWPSTTGLYTNTTGYTYYPESGLVKTDTHYKAENASANTATTYTYDSLGRLLTRVTQRGITTTYGYVPGSGELQSVSYSSSGVPLGYTYDRMGHVQTVTDAAGTRTFHYRALDLQLDYEDLPSAIYGPNCSLNSLFDNLNRPNGRQFVTPALAGSLSSSCTFDPSSGLLQSITTPLSASPFTYTYTPDSHLVASITCAGWPTSGSAALQIVNSYRPDANLISSTATSGAGQVIGNYAYQYDDQDRVQQAARSGELFKYFGSITESFNYDGRDELTNATTTATPNGTAVNLPDRALAYQYDNTGNRTNASRDGLITTYVPNTLSQYESRTGPDVIPMSGLTGSGDSVTLKNDTASSQITASTVSMSAPAAPADYFYGMLGYSGTAGWLSVEADTYNQSTLVHTQQQNMLVPAAAETFQYDGDGNLTSDSLWSYTYDAEQRLVQIQTLSSLPVTVPRKRLNFTYDFLGRRVSKQIYTGDPTGTTWTLADTRCYIYDSWNLLVEMDQSGTQPPVPMTYYAWGLDHSGSLQGAGGAGGLLGLLTGLNTSSTSAYAAVSDGVGNVTGLIDSVNCNLVAEYEYSPFGELIRATGPMAASNPLRFSCKYFDSETSLVNFGFRYYSPSLGRFISRDPKGEQGWANLFNSLGGGGGEAWNYVGKIIENVHEDRYAGKDNAMAETTESGGDAKDSSQNNAPMTDHKGDKSTMAASDDQLPASPTQMAGAPDWAHPYAFLRNSPFSDVEYLGLDGYDDFNNFVDNPSWNSFGAVVDDFAESMGSLMDNCAFNAPSSLYNTVSSYIAGNYVAADVAWDNFMVGTAELSVTAAIGGFGMASETAAAGAAEAEANAGASVTMGMRAGAMEAGAMEAEGAMASEEASLGASAAASAGGGAAAGATAAAEGLNAMTSVASASVASTEMTAGASAVGAAETAPDLRALTTEAHDLLGFKSRFVSTSVGQYADGSLGIASSDTLVPRVQAQWAEANGIRVVNGEGHAEMTLVNGATPTTGPLQSFEVSSPFGRQVVNGVPTNPNGAMCGLCAQGTSQAGASTTSPTVYRLSRNQR